MQTLTEKLMTYALGRSVEYHDMPTVRAIVRDAASDNYRFSSIVMGIVNSAPFQMREVPQAEARGRSRRRRSRQRADGGADHVHHQETSLPPHVPPRRRRRRRPAAARRDDSGGTALAQTAAAPKPRMGFIYLPHGAIMEHWTPAATGTSFELPQILSRSSRSGQQLTIVSGLRNKAGESPARTRSSPAPG